MKSRIKWLNVAEEFRKKIHSVIKCPECNYGYISIKDIAFDQKNFSFG